MKRLIERDDVVDLLRKLGRDMLEQAGQEEDESKGQSYLVGGAVALEAAADLLENGPPKETAQ